MWGNYIDFCTGSDPSFCVYNVIPGVLYALFTVQYFL